MGNQFFHYTSLDATKSILKSHAFRATNIQTFDDKNELTGGLKPIFNYLKTIENLNGLNGITTFFKDNIGNILSGESGERFHCISFCEKENYDFMWQKYALDGCCLCFNKDKLLKAFLELKVYIEGQIRDFKPVDQKFIPCIYCDENNVTQHVYDYLKNAKMPQSINGVEYLVDFEPTKPNVIVRRLTWSDINAKKFVRSKDSPTINIDDNFMILVKLAIILKFSGTNHEYEKEKEERLIFRTFPTMSEVDNGKRRYIELKLDSTLFFEALEEIKIHPCSKYTKKIQSELSSLNQELMSAKLISAPIKFDMELVGELLE